MSLPATALYLDTCLLVSLFHNDAGYSAAEAWLARSCAQELWISHWVLLAFASATALRIRRGELDRARGEDLQVELDTFRAERLALLEPRAEDFLLAQSWLRLDPASGLRAGDALHLAVAHRQGLTVVSADHVLVNAARRLDLRAELVG